MKRVSWTSNKSQADLKLPGFPDYNVLVAENNDDLLELREILYRQGVRDSTGFIKDGINGRIDLPGQLKCDTDGAIEVSIMLDNDQAIKAWFWVIESEEDSPRHLAYWSTVRNRDKSKSWT